MSRPKTNKCDVCGHRQQEMLYAVDFGYLCDDCETKYYDGTLTPKIARRIGMRNNNTKLLQKTNTLTL